MIKLKSKGWGGGGGSEPNYKFILWVIMVYFYFICDMVDEWYCTLHCKLDFQGYMLVFKDTCCLPRSHDYFCVFRI